MKQVVIAFYLLLTPAMALACYEESVRDQSYHVRGNATDLEGKPLYTEELKHTADSSGGQLEVIYRAPDGKQIARKTASYNCNPTTPSFTLEDSVNGTAEGVRWNSDGLESFQQDKMTQMAHPKGPAAVDAGFDNVIKLNWDKLMRKEPVKYSYLFARRNKFLKLRFSRSDPPQAISDKSDEDVVFFKVGANNFLFRMLSSPIYVGYNQSDRSLKYYYGPTNLPMIDMEKPLLISYRNF